VGALEALVKAAVALNATKKKKNSPVAPGNIA
jgi:hypothetical protein